MMGRKWVLPFFFLLIAAGSAPRAVVLTPDDPNYASILALHRDSERADLHIEPYRIGEVRLAKGRGFDIAYVRGDATSSFAPSVAFEEVLYREKTGPWRRIWAEGGNGSNDCAAGAAHYERIIAFVRGRKIDSNALLPDFQRRFDSTKGESCEGFGDFEWDKDFFERSKKRIR